MDKRVIDYPWLMRKLLVGGVIVPRRAEKSAEAYKSIWWEEGSPSSCSPNNCRKPCSTISKCL